MSIGIDCSSVGRAGHLPIRRSLVRSLAPPIYMLMCPWQDTEPQIAPDGCDICVGMCVYEATLPLVCE